MEMSSPTETPTKIRIDRANEYIETRNQYYKNAEELMSRGELRKASEMLWGAVTQTLKALAALRDIEINNHNDFFAATEQLAKEKKDPTIYTTFLELNTLHRNFYDKFIPTEGFPLYASKAREYIRKLQWLIHEVLAQERKEKEAQGKGPT